MLLYAAIGAFGLLFLLSMLFLGEIFHADHDGHVETGGHAEADHGDGPSVFSSRVIGAFLTAFGVGGIVARYLGLSHPAASGIGVATGLVMAAIVYQFARILYAQQASSEVRMTSLVGQAGEVSVGIPPGGVGQVTLTVSGERSTHIARGAGGQGIAYGTGVVITALSGDSVLVEAVGPKARPQGG
jgi:membrane protein implicated in regulation of membrane protease activity